MLSLWIGRKARQRHACAKVLQRMIDWIPYLNADTTQQETHALVCKLIKS
ncbi:hypothetical protein DsansV1_C10g0098421 [Dioscorea sansibarensis]